MNLELSEQAQSQPKKVNPIACVELSCDLHSMTLLGLALLFMILSLGYSKARLVSKKSSLDFLMDSRKYLLMIEKIEILCFLLLGMGDTGGEIDHKTILERVLEKQLFKARNLKEISEKEK